MKVFWCVLSFLCQLELSAQLVLNEMMSYNTSTVQDVDGDYSDWIELFNSGAEAINLADYAIGDDDFNSSWAFPEKVLQSGEYLVVFASGKNYRNPEEELHSDFKIKKSGETIYLYHKTGSIVNYIPAKSLGVDISFARLPDGYGDFALALLSTFAYQNSTDQLLDILSSSHESGVYESRFFLQLSSQEGYDIFYTLDGSIPNPSSPNTFFYTAPIAITDRSGDDNTISNIPTSIFQFPHPYGWRMPGEKLSKGTVIRFRSYKNNLASSMVFTKSFFVFNEEKDPYEFPLVSLVTEAKNLFDDTLGIYVPGIHSDIDNPNWSGNFFYRGRDWERPLHFSIMNTSGDLVYEQNAGVRIKGFGTRAAAQKSLKLYARQDYGDNKFFFDPFGKGLDRYSKLTLKTMFGSWAEIGFTDDIMDGILTDMNLNVLSSAPAVVFVNGEYWGIHNFRESFDEDFLYDHYSYSKSTVSILTGDAVPEYGSNEDYIAMLDYAVANDLSEEIHYKRMEDWMDIDNYIDYLVVETFFANRDWPHNNIKFWKVSNGKWQWHLYDMDAACLYDNVDYNMFDYLDTEDPSELPEYANKLYKNLMESKVFRKRFLEKYIYHLQHNLKADVLKERVTALYRLYYNEMDEHIARWRSPNHKNDWEFYVQDVLKFIDERHCNVREQLKDVFLEDAAQYVCEPSNRAEPEFSLFPNPNNGNFNLIIDNLQLDEEVYVEVFNLLGELQFAQYYKTDGEFLPLDLHLKNGSYILRLHTKAKLEQIPFMVAF